MYIVPTLCLELLSAGQVGRHVLLEGEVGDDGCLGHHAECGLRALAYHMIDTLHRGREGGRREREGERTYTVHNTCTHKCMCLRTCIHLIHIVAVINVDCCPVSHHSPCVLDHILCHWLQDPVDLLVPVSGSKC